MKILIFILTKYSSKMTSNVDFLLLWHPIEYPKTRFRAGSMKVNICSLTTDIVGSGIIPYLMHFIILELFGQLFSFVFVHILVFIQRVYNKNFLPFDKFVLHECFISLYISIALTVEPFVGFIGSEL